MLTTQTGFPPILGVAPRLLILGSVPGERSLALQQYYAHPQNSFWWLFAHSLSIDWSSFASLPYAEKVVAVKSSQIALWDVLCSCRRKGSLDSNIERGTEVYNDLEALISEHQTIKALLFNGKKARALFDRQFANSSLLSDLERVDLPSSSPAYAAMKKSAKLSIWQSAIRRFN
ncbi:MAG: DNA-deoxyinosine glycosylase [Pseudomonadota bacterium]